jgi:chromate transporter
VTGSLYRSGSGGTRGNGLEAARGVRYRCVLGRGLPAFVFVALSDRSSRTSVARRLGGAFLDGVNVASIALMAVVTAQLARAAIVDLPTGALALVAAVLLIRFRVNSAWLVLAGGLVGVVVGLG